ncbi:DUF1617 family protein [Clostridium algidicarnis]|uniref:DUF1617 family protein n=1 Tax=Clostridium algidicarnis TaxID=37659 RepID=UPI001C0E18DE|nr:DUF1617 family protein [Clostridium algidicarnis]MBU3195637.1 DUF1617 family protein [Clostridium algidicarnis]
MKLSNERILNDAAALGSITNKELPIKVSYAIAKNISKIESELKIYNDQKQKLIDKYSEKGEDGKTLIDAENKIKIQDEYLDDWNRDIKELLAIENEVDIHKFNINELVNSNCNMTPAELMLIDYMIEE